MSQGALIIANAQVLALDDAQHEWPCADIVIEGSRIAAIGPGAASAWTGPVARRIDAAGQLAMPGLINAHFHSPGNLMKGCLDGMPLELFMLYEVPPLAAAADSERLIYVRTQLGALEMLRRGITAVHDDAYHVPVASREGIDAIMQAYADVGIRATVAIDQPNVVEYDKYPFLEELLSAEQRAAMDAAPRQSSERTAGVVPAPDRALAWCGRWPIGGGRFLLGAATRQRRLFQRPVGAVARARPAVQHPHPRNAPATRARRRASTASRWCSMCTSSACSINA